jgi:nitrous oxidase accessory protein NosD
MRGVESVYMQTKEFKILETKSNHNKPHGLVQKFAGSSQITQNIPKLYRVEAKLTDSVKKTSPNISKTNRICSKLHRTEAKRTQFVQKFVKSSISQSVLVLNFAMSKQNNSFSVKNLERSFDFKENYCIA